MRLTPKLTQAQNLLLSDISKRDETVSMPYRPALKLIELGYATSRGSAFGAAIISITDAGRAAISNTGGSDAGK